MKDLFVSNKKHTEPKDLYFKELLKDEKEYDIIFESVDRIAISKNEIVTIYKKVL